MNDQSQMMNHQSNPVQVQSHMGMNQTVQSQMMNQHPVQPPLMMNRSYKPWQQQPMKSNFINNNNNSKNSKPNRSNWKGKKVNSERKTPNPNPNNMAMPMPMASGGGGSKGYNPPTLHELQSQNRLKARKFYPKKKFNNRFAPYAPRNTTSFIIRAKKAGGIASLVSPCPVTPAVLPTPIFSPSREVLGDMAKEEWGVDGYGSMKGLIRLRSPPGHDIEAHDDEDEEEGNGSSESDVEEHVEVERRLDHDLSRFEMIYPNYGAGDYNNVLENRVDDQDSHIAQLEEENLTLKERLFLMERELGDLRRRMQFLERRSHVVEDVNEEVVENESENDSEGGSDVRGGTGSDNHHHHHHHQEVMVEYVDVKELNNEGVGDVCMEEFVPDAVVAKEDESKDGEAMNVGNEILSDKMVAKKDESKHGEAMNVGNEIVSEKLVAKEGDTDESKGEEGEKEILGNEIVAEKIDNESRGEGEGEEAGNEFVREEMNGEQHNIYAEKEESNDN